MFSRDCDIGEVVSNIGFVVVYEIKLFYEWVSIFYGVVVDFFFGVEDEDFVEEVVDVVVCLV